MTARCLELHDLAAAKLVAGREKDVEFLIEMVRHGMRDVATMRERIQLLPENVGEGADLSFKSRQ